MPENGGHLLVAERVSKAFPGVKALQEVEFGLRRGEIHAVVGENGAGKTTLMMILCGVYQPDGGRLWLDGKEVRIKDTTHAQRLGISTVFQELSLVPGLTVAENIFLSRVPVRTFGIVDWQGLTRKAREILGRLGIEIDPFEQVRKLPASLRQLVEIAKALSQDAKILLLDEPTSSLSQPEADCLFKVLRQVRDQGLGLVIITHRVSEVFSLADRITVLRDGRKVLTTTTVDTTPDAVVLAMIGREVHRVERVTATRGKEPLLEVKNLHTTQLRGVDLTVYPGEILGVGGLAGSGRSDLGLALFGAERWLAGEMRLARKKVLMNSPVIARRYGIAYLPPDRKTSGLFLSMSVQDNIVSASLENVSTAGLLRPRVMERLAMDLSARIRIRCRNVKQEVRTLSGGNQQKVMLARLLATHPRVLVVDDPTVGVDTGAKAEIHQFLLELASQGTAIILISSDLSELMTLSKRIMVLRDGYVAGTLEENEFSEAAIMHLAAG